MCVGEGKKDIVNNVSCAWAAFDHNEIHLRLNHERPIATHFDDDSVNVDKLVLLFAQLTKDTIDGDEHAGSTDSGAVFSINRTVGL